MRAKKNRHLGKKLMAAVLALGFAPVAGVVGTANAQDSSIQYKKATFERPVEETNLPDGRKIVSVWSHAMKLEIPNIVQPPRNGNQNAPVLYLINGAGGGEDSATWQAQTDVKNLMGDKNVWTVTPIGGRGTYYTDWLRHDPNAGTRISRETQEPIQLERFLTWELPFQFENRYGGAVDGNRKRGIAAISMTGTSVLNFANHSPGRFQFVGSYSGCAETATPIGHAAIDIVTKYTGGPNLDNMWGPFPGDRWAYNDPVAMAPELVKQRDNGTLPEIYVTTGNGLPGPHENLENWRIRNNVPALANQTIVGGIIEAATNYCTGNLARRYNELGIPATFNFKQNGTHSWGYWQDDLHDSWPRMAHALGV